MTAVDLFAGAGGLSLGFEMCGFDVVLACERDLAAAEAYRRNHPSTEMITGDITALDLEQTFSPLCGRVDAVIGGPPCQGFSQKGKRLTDSDGRNFLFRQFASAVEILRPRYFVLENVPNILAAAGGRFRKEIAGVFSSLGYSMTYGVLNAADFGVPENRRRAFFIGRLDGPAPKLPKPYGGKVTVWDAISDLAFLASGEGEEEQEYRSPPQTTWQEQIRNGSTVLRNHVAAAHTETTLERLALIPPNAGREVLPEEHLTRSVYSGTWSRMKADEPAVTITTRFDTPSSGRFTHPYLDRTITVREAARLQSFPDTYVFTGAKACQMKQVGNAVPPLLARAVAEALTGGCG